MNKYGEQEPFYITDRQHSASMIIQIHEQTKKKKSMIFILVIKAKNPFATFK